MNKRIPDRIRQHRIVDYAYFRDITLVTGCDKELDRWVKRRDAKLTWTAGNSGRYVLFPNDPVHYILLSNRTNLKWTTAVLGHEVLHLAFSVLRSAGIRYCNASEEAFTYYFQGVFSQCLRHISD